MSVFRNLNQRFRKRGFTDQLYWLNFKIAWFYVGACFVLTVFSGLLDIPDLSIISVGIPAVFTELGIHTAVIVNKAKHENINKYKGDEF